VRTLTAQAAITACLLVFAVLALRTGRQISSAQQPVHRYLWTFTGWTFLIQGANSGFHDAFSIYAFRQGAGSRALEVLLLWHPPLNHSRTFLLVAFCGVTCHALVRGRRGLPLPSLRSSVAIVVAGMAGGALLGMNEAAFSYLTHFTAVASWDAVELLAMMAVLLVGLSTGLMDRAMWACLGITAFALALSTVWFIFLSRSDLVGEWAPKAFHIQWTKVVLYLVMNAIVVIQHRRLNRGRSLRGFFEAPARTPVPSWHG
jgi:hypothetical protein